MWQMDHEGRFSLGSDEFARLMASARFTYVGLAGFGIEITETESSDI